MGAIAPSASVWTSKPSRQLFFDPNMSLCRDARTCVLSIVFAANTELFIFLQIFFLPSNAGLEAKWQ